MMENGRWQMANAENLSLAMLPVHVNEAVLQITDVNGKVIESFMVSGVQGEKVWNTSNLVPGTYFYNLQTKDFNRYGKIIVH